MEYSNNGKSIIITISAATAGKFRPKTRETALKFGKNFAARQTPWTEQVYFEWQIGYDALVKDVQDGKKHTKLIDETFTGANGKIKYLYELSELLYEAIKINLINRSDIESLLNEVSDFKELIDKNEIEVGVLSEVELNGVKFQESYIKLPTLFMTRTPDGTQIEVSIQKQQYASGVQPMLYFCIPLSAFKNGREYLNKPSLPGELLHYEIDSNNVVVLTDMFRIFAMCSKNHQHDIIQILTLILKITNNANSEIKT